MKVRFPLYAQTLSFLFLHLTLLAALFLIFFNTQFGLGWEALINSAIGERLEGIAWVINRQIEVRPIDSWNSILDEFGKIYGVKFYIFNMRGEELAGEPVQLPAPVVLRIVMRRPHFPGHPFIRAPFDGPPPPPLPSPGRAFLRPPLDGPPPVPAPFPNYFLNRPRGRFLVHTASPDSFWVGARIHLFQPQEGPGTLLASTKSLWQTRLFLDFEPLVAAIIAILFLSVIIWWPFVYRISRALIDLTQATEKIAEGRFDTHLKVDRPDEIGSLAEAVNVMAFRLNTFVTGQKRFLGDIAHELASPISRLQVALELLKNSGSPEQEATIQDVEEEVEEMTSLINELLAFSQAGLMGRDIQLMAVDIEPLLKKAIAKTSSQDIVNMEVDQGLSVCADQLLLERALTNILRNSVRYAGSYGPIHIKATQTGNNVFITITDQGPGVPPEAIKMLGEPFYRPEPSRSRSSGGVGLGLAIVKTCVEACNGTFNVRNHQPSGLEVKIQLQAYNKTELTASVQD